LRTAILPFPSSPPNFTFILLAQRAITLLFFAGFAPSFSSAFGSWKRNIETFHEKQDKFFAKQVDFWAKVHLFFMKPAQQNRGQQKEIRKVGQ
jgi:hypothetical protein